MVTSNSINLIKTLIQNNLKHLSQNSWIKFNIVNKQNNEFACFFDKKMIGIVSIVDNEMFYYNAIDCNVICDELHEFVRDTTFAINNHSMYVFATLN